MAVTKNPTQLREPGIEEEVEPSSEGVKNTIRRGNLQLRKLNGALTACPDMSEGTSCHVHMHNGGNRKAAKIDESESLSDIDDVEVSEYLNTEQQMHYKRMLWEVINQNYLKAKKLKHEAEVKTRIPVKRAAKAPTGIGKKKPSSKINYDALRKLADELDKGGENADQEGVTSGDFFFKRTDEPWNGR